MKETPLSETFRDQCIQILSDLGYFFDKISNTNYKKGSFENGYFIIRSGDLHSFKPRRNKPEDIYNVASFLKKEGIDLEITFDFVNEAPSDYPEYVHESDDADHVPIAKIKDHNIEGIKKKISLLSAQLLKNENKGLPKITYSSITGTGSVNAKKFKFKHHIPSGTEWGNFTFSFQDSEHVQVIVGAHNETLSYKDFGLENMKNGKPKISWAFFVILAKNNGELKPDSNDKKDSYKKAAQGLRKSLKSFFSIDYDPFYSYKKSMEKKSGNSYKSKFTVFYKNEAIDENVEEESSIGQFLDIR